MWTDNLLECLNVLSIISLYSGSLFLIIGSAAFLISYELIHSQNLKLSKTDDLNLQQVGILISLISGIVFLFGTALACVLSICSPFEIEKIWIIQQAHKTLAVPIHALSKFLTLIKMITLVIGLTYTTFGFFEENCTFKMDNENYNPKHKIGFSWILIGWIAIICSMTLEITEFWIADLTIAEEYTNFKHS